MNSSLIAKIEKGIIYAKEKDRARFKNFTLDFHGNNGDHKVTFDTGSIRCDCEYYRQTGTCSHTIAVERMLGEMVEVRAAA